MLFIQNAFKLGRRLKKVASLDIPSLIGFGIRDKQSFQHAASFSDGAIIGTAFIKALEQGSAADFIDALL